jgi:disulfide oxidoreductase YuzD
VAAEMKTRLFTLCLIVAAILPAVAQDTRAIQVGPETSRSERRLANAFAKKIEGFQIRFNGVVVRNFADEKHFHVLQEFILQLSTGQTLLIVHDKTIGEGVPRVRLGNKMTVLGVYRWNAKGGYIIQTTRKADGSAGGWIRRNGKRYE